MKRNIGGIDRVLRVLLGLGAIAGAFVVGVGAAIGIVLLVIAAVLLLTALVSFCPIYALLGIDSCSIGHRPLLHG